MWPGMGNDERMVSCTTGFRYTYIYIDVREGVSMFRMHTL